MIALDINEAKLAKSMQKYARLFGDSSAQAVMRWSVQTCRELAREVEPKPRKGMKSPQKIQKEAIIKDALRVLYVCQRMRKTKRGYKCFFNGATWYAPQDRVLTSPAVINQWIELNRTGKSKRTKELSKGFKRVCTRAMLNKALRERNANIGIAKGGWIGAGKSIGKKQKGGGKITIAGSFMRYAQQHNDFGSARAPTPGFRPVATMQHRARHIADGRILKKTAYKTSAIWGLRKTLTWYRKTLKAIEKK